MHTEPKPVEPIKRPPLTENSELPPTAEELENVTIRVVRLDQLAGAAPAERAAQPAGPRNGMQRSSALPATVAAPPASARAAPRAPAPAAPRAPAAATPRAPAPAAPSPAHEERRPTPPAAAPPAAAAPASIAAPAVKASSPAAPAPVARTPASPAMRPAEAPAARSPEVPAARQTPGNRTATAVARPSARVETVEKPRKFSWNRVAFIALVVVIYLGWSMPT